CFAFDWRIPFAYGYVILSCYWNKSRHDWLTLTRLRSPLNDHFNSLIFKHTTTHTRTHTHTHTHASANMHTHTHPHTHAYTHISTRQVIRPHTHTKNISLYHKHVKTKAC